MAKDEYGFETLALHAGAAPDSATGARAVPIYQNTSYVFDDADHAASLFNLQEPGFIYSRLTNPTVAVLEERLAALEQGIGATATASGHAAQMIALLPLMGPGDHIIASSKLYGGSITQMGHTFKKFGWQVSFVDPSNPDAFQKALTARTKAIFVECLANPGGVVLDLEPIAAIAHGAGIPLIVDNTMATPYLCRPGEFGADIVTHSTTKFLSGQGTALGGAVIDCDSFDFHNPEKFPSLATPAPEYHGLTFTESFGNLAYTLYGHAVGLRDLGPTQQPMNAFLTILGIETLPVRMDRHIANARIVADYLDGHAAIASVGYAGLPSSPYYDLARKYMPKGPGSVFTFKLKGGYEVGRKLVNAVELFSHLANIGDAKSLILHPASTTHNQLTKEQQTAAGAGPDVIRLSIGLETVEDLIRDLDRALAIATA
ncbi:MAG: O-acetylhomoserine aminocarboxypropyltransferase [Rhodospirillaceae bacterium]|nr:O-acetylhomoserine aminocarboxypropyltransferase [Rhodospirillaceae bacterium]MAX64713.1 O-acetylhomoserine aminocarboxypropyltransferase [Rhodospirillaceae bacterium]MBB58685.1 O-acetylhomoserine aminocarboxypropyltransferase [Rhodospirillaceae bacterium]|tara:strand:+ start:60476 stop:61765 length:1290 start_codon:yes stop_codon:yes gene_type:complete